VKKKNPSKKDQPLTERNIRFCEEYLVDLNATQAAIRAGYSEKTAAEQSSRLLKNVKISALIQEMRDKRSTRTEITQDYVLRGLQEVAERCLQRVPVMKWDYNERQMVQVKDDDDNNVWQFDSAGANRAFELLGKHVGVFEKDNSQRKQDTQSLNSSQVDQIIAELRKKR